MFTKINKRKAVALAKSEKSVKLWLCPSNSYPCPSFPFNVAVSIEVNEKDLVPFGELKLSQFERHINAYKHYNCNKELGKRVNFFIEIS